MATEFRPVHKLQPVQYKYDNTTDEEFYLRDLLLAVEQRNLQMVKFMMPCIKEQENFVIKDIDKAGQYFSMATENSSNYRWVLGEALRMASHHGVLDIVEFLISSGAELNDGDDQGGTPLMKACEQEHLDVVKKILDSGADINKVNHVGSTALQRTSRLPDKWSIIAELLSRKNVDVNNSEHKSEKSALHCAAELDDIGNNTRLLLEHFAAQNARDKEGKTPLHLACERGLYCNVRLLIQFGAFLNLKDHVLGSTPLHLAAQNGYVDICRLLISCGADTSSMDKYGLTPKQRMVNHGKIKKDKQPFYEQIVELIDQEANKIQEQKRLLMADVMADVCEMIPTEKWQKLYEDIFKNNVEAEKILREMEGKLPFEALPILAHHILIAWLDHCSDVANFWVFDRALRDHDMHSVANELVSKHGHKF